MKKKLLLKVLLFISIDGANRIEEEESYFEKGFCSSRYLDPNEIALLQQTTILIPKEMQNPKAQLNQLEQQKPYYQPLYHQVQEQKSLYYEPKVAPLNQLKQEEFSLDLIPGEFLKKNGGLSPKEKEDFKEITKKNIILKSIFDLFKQIKSVCIEGKQTDKQALDAACLSIITSSIINFNQNGDKKKFVIRINCKELEEKANETLKKLKTKKNINLLGEEKDPLVKNIKTTQYGNIPFYKELKENHTFISLITPKNIIFQYLPLLKNNVITEYPKGIIVKYIQNQWSKITSVPLKSTEIKNYYENVFDTSCCPNVLIVNVKLLESIAGKSLKKKKEERNKRLKRLEEEERKRREEIEKDIKNINQDMIYMFC